MTDFDNIQQNLNTPLVNNNDDIELSVKALPFIFNNDQNTKHNYNNNGNKIICPKHILYELSKYENICYPVTIKIKDIYFGVLEFKEFIDEIYIPDNLFYSLNINENDVLDITILKKELPKASYIKIKAMDEDFYSIENKKTYLETHMKNLFNVISENSSIHLIYKTKTIEFKILECKPDKHVSIDEIEELEIDLEPLVKPTKKRKIIASINTSLNKSSTNNISESKDNTFVPFSGKSNKLGGN
jgi:hypothetical protein